MREIDLSVLQIGQVTDREYFTVDGELLISGNVRLTQQHLNALKRRNVTRLYYKGEAEEEELRRILSTQFEKLCDIPADTPQEHAREPSEDIALDTIRAGKDGLIQLMKSAKGSELDRRLKEGRSPDTPVGPALKDKATRLDAKTRTEQYRAGIQQSYDEALASTRRILDALVAGKCVDGGMIRSIAQSFTSTFLIDRDILLNMAGARQSDAEYVYGHSLNVCLIAINIAASYGYSREQVVEIGIGALLHDVGMLMVPAQVKLKRGRLADDEWYEIQKHPVLGLHLLEKVSHLPEAVPYVAYQCHERENGKGYPKQRSSRLIHNYAKVVTVADVYEALCSPRAYREPNMPYKAMEMLIKMTRQGLISGEFVKAFLEYTSLFPVGSAVELSNGCIGRVVRANGSSFAKPTVCVMIDSNGRRLPKDRMYEEDLGVNTSLQIVKAHFSDVSGGGGIMVGF